jgi:hypothetical protein
MALRGTIADLNQRRKKDIVSRYADDAVLVYAGMGALKIRGGKVADLQDFYFDVVTLQKMWGE